MNNRQNGRRRGRGGQQARQPGAPDRGSRLDNRARGNAAQLLEKYKTLARDAQMQGDRVNTEYYLQFADHYFRVLSESRSRFEEQRRAREDYRDDAGGDEDAGDGPQRGYQSRDENADDNWDDGDRAEGSGEGQRAEPQRRPERPAYQNEGDGEARQREARPPRERTRRAPVANGGGNGHEDAEASGDAAPARIEIDRVPPALIAEPAPAPAETDDAEAAAAKPRRRTRRPRAETAPVEA